MEEQKQSVMPKSDENAAERAKFHAWCREQGFEPDLWMPNQPWCGYTSGRVQDYWTGWLGRAGINNAEGIRVKDGA